MGNVSNRQPQDVRPHATVGARAAAIVVAIAAAAAIVVVMNASITGGNPPTTSAASSTSAAASASNDVIYPDNAAINAFVVAFNRVNPEHMITAPDLKPTWHNGAMDTDGVTAVIAGKPVTIIGAKSSDDSSVSVSWAPGYTKKNDLDKPTHRTFVLVMRAMDSEASNDEVEARWNEVKLGADSASWDDHTIQFTGNAPLDGPGSSTAMQLAKLDRAPIGADDDS